MSGAGISVSAGIPDFRTPGHALPRPLSSFILLTRRLHWLLHNRTGLYYNLQQFNLPTPASIFDIEYAEPTLEFAQCALDLLTATSPIVISCRTLSRSTHWPRTFIPAAIRYVFVATLASKALFSLHQHFLMNSMIHVQPTVVHYFIRLLADKGLLLRHYTQVFRRRQLVCPSRRFGLFACLWWTQNIDGLERVAGVPVEKLVEAHGSFFSAHCAQCLKVHDPAEIRGIPLQISQTV